MLQGSFFRTFKVDFGRLQVGFGGENVYIELLTGFRAPCKGCGLM